MEMQEMGRGVSRWTVLRLGASLGAAGMISSAYTARPVVTAVMLSSDDQCLARDTRGPCRQYSRAIMLSGGDMAGRTLVALVLSRHDSIRQVRCIPQPNRAVTGARGAGLRG